MHKTIYTCDLCKKQVKDKFELFELSIHLNNKGGFQKAWQSLEICTLCAEKKGIVKRVLKGDETVEEVQDVKDRLYDIVVEIIEDCGIPVETEQ